MSSEFAKSVERRSAAEIDLKKLPLLLPKTKARSVKRESARQRLVQRQKTFSCDARRHGGVGGWRQRTDTTSPPRCCSPAIPQRTSSRGTKRARIRVDGGGRRLEKNNLTDKHAPSHAELPYLEDTIVIMTRKALQ